MLRRQSPDSTPTSFLIGDGEMATRIRDFPWADHPFGPPETWPVSLRSALGICLNSAFPTAIYWGPDLRLLYNDAWSTIPGPRHPACLGEPCREVWSDIWDVIEPQFARVIETGQGFAVTDQLLPMRRFGIEEETYWSYSFTPIRDEDGTIAGIFNSGQESTGAVLKQRQTAFLLSLIDALRAVTGAERVMETVCAMLGAHLDAARVGIREAGAVPDALPVVVEWSADGRPRAASEPWSTFDRVADELDRGHVVRIPNVAGLRGSGAQAVFEGLGAASVLGVPWHAEGRLRAVLYVHRAAPHVWTDDEVATVEQVFARTIQAVDADRVLAREKVMMDEIDHRARNLLGISQALVRLTRADDVETFRTSLTERMGALGQTLGILSAAAWEGAPLDALLGAELAPYLADDRPQAKLTGPRVLIPSGMAQPIAMAIHELTTNALKYGALSDAGGHLDVAWSLSDDGALTFDWQERGDPIRPDAPDPEPRGGGFGNRLLSLVIETQLHGTLTRSAGAGRYDIRFTVPGVGRV